jgi:hypothetical protein
MFIPSTGVIHGLVLIQIMDTKMFVRTACKCFKRKRKHGEKKKNKQHR